VPVYDWQDGHPRDGRGGGGEAMTDEPIWIKCVSCEPTVRNLWKRIAALETELTDATNTIRELEAALAKAEEE
jgi:hypothetical protein